MGCKFENDSANNDTAESSLLLPNSLGRFPTLRIRESETPQLGNKNLRDHQLCVIHAINHWCKDREGNDIAESVRMDIIADHDDLKLENQGNTIFRRLTDPNITVNQKVAAVTEKHRDFFGRKALDVQTKYEKEKLNFQMGLPPICRRSMKEKCYVHHFSLS